MQNRTLRTKIDTTVTTGSGEEVPVHVFGQDEMLNDHVVAAIHERPDEGDITNLLAIALDVDAHAMVITTSGTVVGEDIDQLITDDPVTILQLTKDDTLQPEYETISDPTTRNSIVARIANIFEPQTG
ncbi:hypothetical protein [Haladaptatus sp. NG-WS-4]